ncbi:hypothetical protein, partial [Rhodococcus sp. C-2]|uniref:hypothetical protein n=1 Tax=Rhodococcus sp. C-2 TaxID=3018809 RepID=UPI0022EB9EAC
HSNSSARTSNWAAKRPRGAPPGAARRETERVAALPAREPLRGSRWVTPGSRRAGRCAPLETEITDTPT